MIRMFGFFSVDGSRFAIGPPFVFSFRECLVILLDSHGGEIDHQAFPDFQLRNALGSRD